MLFGNNNIPVNIETLHILHMYVCKQHTATLCTYTVMYILMYVLKPIQIFEFQINDYLQLLNYNQQQAV